jgi:enamine deaminase RidA (YjgF/YER057c/UK114 family)
MEGQKDSVGSIKAYFERNFALNIFNFVFINFAVSGNGFEKALERVFQRCERTLGLKNIVRLTLFIPPFLSRKKVFEAINYIFSGSLPATSFIPQPLCNSKALGGESWAFIPKKQGDRIKKITKNLTVADISSLKWAFVSGIESEEKMFLNEKVDNVLKETDRILNTYGFGIHQLVRTWFYTGDILGKENGTLRYDVMNRIRNKFYRNVGNDGENYPASTGIGINGKGFILDGIAFQSNQKDVNIKRISNPLQTNPFNYDKSGEDRPAFSRAVAISFNNYHIIFISGTASIRESEVVFKENIEKQTETTINNIVYLIGENNLRKYNISKGASLEDIQQIRVYIKRNEDYDIVKRICEQAFGMIPQMYCLADICRPSLLIEIEAVALIKQ